MATPRHKKSQEAPDIATRPALGSDSAPDAAIVTVDTAIGRGVYSNVAAVRHTPLEFFIDFLVQYGTELHLVSRVVLSPNHARRLAAVLQENVALWQQAHADERTGEAKD